MRSHIDEMIASRGTVTLREVVEAFPPQVGIIELLGYLQLAKDERHLISQNGTEEIRLPPRGDAEEDLIVTVPLVYFMKTGEAAHA